MYQFKLTRKGVHSQDTTQLVGYNYYIVISFNEQIIKEQLIHTTVNTSNPTDLLRHDLIAKEIYNTHVNKDLNPDEMPSMSKDQNYPPKIRVGQV